MRCIAVACVRVLKTESVFTMIGNSCFVLGNVVRNMDPFVHIHSWICNR